ncbi:hypothetical protein [Lacticaseibacillus mingshuiensis]|uniref:Uncharacterized protein n=1 Tax=Lacticaseibacillus mingshuiensis TaxID=2799574 RepID=A0ABW4CH94_9LACO|nr:hypothetical protein [Lacticaseibacillus mingshuiensis]
MIWALTICILVFFFSTLFSQTPAPRWQRVVALASGCLCAILSLALCFS